MRRSLSCAAVLAVLSAVSPPATASAAACVPTVLPTPPGATVQQVTGTDQAGTWVGVATDQDGEFGVVWRDGGVARLPYGLVPADMNRGGLISGHVWVENFPEEHMRGAVMVLDGEITYLDSGYRVVAAGVNERGDAVGWNYPVHPVVHFTALWPAADRSMRVLDPAWYVPLDIDDGGLSAGLPAEERMPQRVWRFDGSVLREFGPYGPGETSLRLADIDDGKVAATRTDQDGTTRVVVIDAVSGRGVAMAGSEGGTALELENGVVVGKGPRGAMLWRRTAATVLPAPAGMTTREATAVAGDGTEAAGISVAADGTPSATLWRCS